MKSSLLPVKPGTRRAVPRGSRSTGSSTQDMRAPCGAGSVPTRVPGGGTRKGGVLTLEG